MYQSRNPNPGLLTPKFCAETLLSCFSMNCYGMLKFASVCFSLTPNCLAMCLSVQIKQYFSLALIIGGKGKKLESWVSFNGAPKSLYPGGRTGASGGKEMAPASDVLQPVGEQSTTTTGTTKQTEESKGRATERLPRKRLPNRSSSCPLSSKSQESIFFDIQPPTTRNNPSGPE